jgi:hypothetical protein
MAATAAGLALVALTVFLMRVRAAGRPATGGARAAAVAGMGSGSRRALGASSRIKGPTVGSWFRRTFGRSRKPKMRGPTPLQRIRHSSMFERLRYSNLAESLRARSSARRVRSNIGRRSGGPAKQPPKLKKRR